MASKVNDLIQFADHMGRRKIEDRRYEDQKAMQLAQIGEKKNQELKVIKGQQFLNNMTSGLMKSGWDENGMWNSDTTTTNGLVNTYIDNMKSIGLAGDAGLAMQRVEQFKQMRLQKGSQQLAGKISMWDAEHKNDYKDWDPFTGEADLKKDRKAYIKSIGGDKLYMELMGMGGAMKATEMTGMTPDMFDKPAAPFGDSKLSEQIGRHPWVAGGTGLAVGGAAVGTVWGTLSAMGKSIANGEVLRAGKDGAIKEVTKLTAELNALKATKPTKEVLSNISKMEKHLEVINKRGYIDKSSWKVLDKLKAAIPKGVVDNSGAIKKGEAALTAAETALKNVPKQSMTSKILKQAKGIVPWLAPGAGQMIDEQTGIDAPIGQTVGTGYLAKKIAPKAKKSFLAYLGKRFPAMAAKAGLAASADGPFPIGDLLAVGFTAWEIKKVYSEWANQK